MYIESGTFWLVTIILGATIGIVYYVLNKKAEKNSQSIMTIHKALQEITKLIDQEFEDVRNEAHRGNAEIYENVADAIEQLENKIDKKKKKKQ